MSDAGKPPATRESDRRMLKDRDEDYERAAEERDALKAEVERLRADQKTCREWIYSRSNASERAALEGNWRWQDARESAKAPPPPAAKPEPSGAKAAPPSPVPIDPRAALIAKGAIRLAAARYGIDKGDTDTEEWALAMASGLLRAAEAEARKGGS